MTKKRKLFIMRIFIFVLFIIRFNCFAQVGGIAINSTGNAADNSAMLDISATNQGMLIPRLTTLQRDSIAYKCSCVPAEGLQIFNTTNNCFEAYFGSVWQPLTCLCSSAPAAAGSISGTSTVCPGQNAVLYSVPAIARATSYIWTYSGAGAVIIGSTNAVIVYFSLAATSGNLTVIAANACGNGTVSAVYPIDVNSTAPNITAQPLSATTCLGSGDITYTVTATGGLTYQWQEYISSWNNLANAGVYSNVTTATLTITNPPLGIDAYKYRCIVSGTCTSTTSDGLATLTVSPVSVGGTATATASTLCSGNSTTITLAGNTGNIQWQQSANGTSGWANVSGGTGSTSATYTTPNLTSSTYYRAQVTNSVCNSDYSSTALVTVDPVSLGGTATATESAVCTDSSTTITLTDYTGTIQWQQSADGTSGWANVSGGTGSTSATYTTPNLTSSIYYRALVTSGVCNSANSSTALVTVTPLPVATFSYTSTPYCSNASNPSPTFSGGGLAGTFSSTTGLVFVSTSTGQVNLTSSTPGTYTVTNTIAASGGCGIVTATSGITINSAGIAATGGTITNVDGRRIHTFTASGTFTITSNPCYSTLQVLVIGGGGGGGGADATGGGGGGAGGYQENLSVTATVQAYPITVGGGGSGGSGGCSTCSNGTAGSNGSNSSAFGITSLGGGGGAGRGTQSTGKDGGSGGGNADNGGPSVGLGTSGQGHNGGISGGMNAGGAGGGAGVVGGNGNSSGGGVGGNGLSSTISGAAVTRAGGGGGGPGISTPCYCGTGLYGPGGSGGGGAGGNNTTGGAGAANTGSGGGGGGSGPCNGCASGGGGVGGSGIVIISYVP
ncbi:MAG: hypothetical protein HGB12_05450 [Bacteroidetes bacterium]|nr:hypothetical protein [Bacteroidota bacterium]